MKFGKYCASSSGSVSSWIPPDLTWIFFVRLMTRESYESAFSSIEPMLL